MSIPSTHDTIIWRLHLRSSPRRVYQFLATGAGRELFWAESAPEREGAIHFRFINGMETASPILRRDPPRGLEIEYFGANVVFELTDDARGGTDLTMTTTGFPPEDREELHAGWLNVLLPLKAAADFGVDLRNHDPARTWDAGYADQ